MGFNVGDRVKLDIVGRVVQLKSGGPLMCVQSFRIGQDKLSVSCTWFDGAAKEASFPIDCLVIPDRWQPIGEELGRSS
jgi:uncharacterized protein YodC (DUF2158 family)